MAAARFDNSDGRIRGRALQARRLRKWTAADGQCAKCGCLTAFADPRTNPKGFHLDHIAMFDKSRDDREENTQVLCVPCHDKKTQVDMGHQDRLTFSASGRVQW